MNENLAPQVKVTAPAGRGQISCPQWNDTEYINHSRADRVFICWLTNNGLPMVFVCAFI